MAWIDRGVCEDVIHFKDGSEISGSFEVISDRSVIMVSFGAAGGKAKRTVKADQIDYLVFGFEAGEKAFFERLASASSDEIEPWWNLYSIHLTRPRSRSAVYGNAFAEALLREGAGSDRALAVFDRVIAKAWSASDRMKARQGRVRALMASGQLEIAMAEAGELLEETEDPVLMLEVHLLKAEGAFERLKALEKEHPKWDEDDEVRPERDALYHQVLDEFLWPSLFHGAHVELAAKGLFSAAHAYEFGGDRDGARAALGDLIHLYPSSSLVAVAKEQLEHLPESSQ